jgi:hypothetical protein
VARKGNRLVTNQFPSIRAYPVHSRDKTWSVKLDPSGSERKEGQSIGGSCCLTEHPRLVANLPQTIHQPFELQDLDHGNQLVEIPGILVDQTGADPRIPSLTSTRAPSPVS